MQNWPPEPEIIRNDKDIFTALFLVRYEWNDIWGVAGGAEMSTVLWTVRIEGTIYKGNAQVEASTDARNEADFLLRIAPHRGEARICLQIAPWGALPHTKNQKIPKHCMHTISLGNLFDILI